MRSLRVGLGKSSDVIAGEGRSEDLETTQCSRMRWGKPLGSRRKNTSGYGLFFLALWARQLCDALTEMKDRVASQGEEGIIRGMKSWKDLGQAELCKPWWRCTTGEKRFSRESLCGPICWSSSCSGSVSWWYNRVQDLVSWKLQEAVRHKLSSCLGIKHLSPDDWGFCFMEKMQRNRKEFPDSTTISIFTCMPFLLLQLQDGLCSAWARYPTLGFKLSHWVGDIVLMTFSFQHCMAPVNSKFTTCVSIIREFWKTNHNTFASFPSPRLPHQSVRTSLPSLSRK